MPTPAEKKALLFLASVAVLGASVRALRAVGAIQRAPDASIHDLDRQLDAVDSARQARKGKSKGKGRSELPNARSGVDTTTTKAVSPASIIDVDVASAEQLHALPGVGPVLAKRIVEDRNQRGSFGSLVNLKRVKGIGPALAQKLAPLVTFSGAPRPLSATPPDSLPFRRPKASRGCARAPPALPLARVPRPATWPLPSSPSSASVISSFARGSSRGSSLRARSTNRSRTERASVTISSSSASFTRTSSRRCWRDSTRCRQSIWRDSRSIRRSRR